MNEDIIFLLPNEAVSRQAEQILKKEGIAIPVYHAFMESGVALASRNIEQGAKVIISRGSTVRLLREYFTVPIVEVRYAFYEFAVAMQRAVKESRRIGLMGYNDAFNRPELADFFCLEQLEIRVVDPADTQKTLEELKALGVELIISGQNIGEAARRAGLKSVLVRISRKNLLDAVTDASHLCNLEIAKQHQFSSIAALLDRAQEGILSIDRQGRIISLNRIAQQMLHLNGTGQREPVFNYVPRDIVSQILGGLPLYNEVISLHGENVLLSGTAAHPDEESSGAVLTLLPATDVHQKEYELRRRSRSKGHTAKNTFEQIIGASPALVEVKQQARLFAATESNVLIYGPTGTGKELFAQSIHNASSRRGKPFVAINCAAPPESVLESELFGYVKGAFTGARPEGKTGIFEQAHTGTIFLDEISEISPAVQARLLRVIQEREITRIGDDKIIPIDVRIIASTNRNLQEEISNKRFREDLYYRLSVLNLSIPPLRSRKGDVPLLVDYFIQHFSRTSGRQLTMEPDAMLPLDGAEWRGNIRQLRNIVECAAALCQEDTISRQLIEQVLRISIQDTSETPAPAPAAHRGPEQEQARVLAVLDACGGNKTRAARQLGISYTTLWRRLKQWGMV